MSEEVIEHHGVKGMRWGVRKGKGKPIAKTSGPGTGYRNYDISKLNNHELANVVNRMHLEKRYKELNKQDPHTMASVLNGKKIAEKFVNSAIAGASDATKQATSNALRPLIEKQINILIAGNAPQKKSKKKP